MYYGIFIDDTLVETANSKDEAISIGIDYMFEYDSSTVKEITKEEYDKFEEECYQKGESKMAILITLALVNAYLIACVLEAIYGDADSKPKWNIFHRIEE